MGVWLWRYIIGFCLCVSVGSVQSSVDAYNTELQLSFIPLAETRLKDGLQLGRGQVMCASQYNRVRVWIDPNVMAPDRQSYYLYLNNNREANIQVRLQGYGWQQEIGEENGIIKNDIESRAMFDIIVHGEQAAIAGEYPLHINAVCF